MRLLTQNMLQCNVKGCDKDNFPLTIKATELKREETEFKSDFIVHIIPKLDWDALVKSAKDVGLEIPSSVPENAAENEEFLKNVHGVLLEVVVDSGELICNNCSRSYPIANGIPNMLLKETEV
eukprot:TRINITY_DN648_c0_g1_i1.p1 TRINITY_DN648_c0_g1~~TRINITY_DN648_c0_g1_i1.p1  ORF type:complete len:123 (-),score=28.49 TRINITY_DN648_c0_g1_i1:80-448(-)